MNKDIRDYLHLYLGCEAYWQIDGRKSTYARKIDFDMLRDADWIKPILRPLSDMTEEDVSDWGNVNIAHTPYCVELDSKDDFGEFTCVYPDGSILSRSKDDGDIRPINGGELFRLLLSKHFDLFGLIDAKIALDKTKQ